MAVEFLYCIKNSKLADVFMFAKGFDFSANWFVLEVNFTDWGKQLIAANLNTGVKHCACTRFEKNTNDFQTRLMRKVKKERLNS